MVPHASVRRDDGVDDEQPQDTDDPGRIASAIALTAWTYSAPIAAQTATAPAVQSAPTVDPALYGGMRWRSVGPARGGRSLTVGGSDARPNEYWFGATGGGAWKTTDGGNNWAPMTDGKITTSSIGSLGVCQSNPDVVYIGGGETRLPRQHHPGRRRLQDHRRRQDVDAPAAAARLAGHRPHAPPPLTNCDIVLRGGVRARSTTTTASAASSSPPTAARRCKKTLFRDDKTGAVDLVHRSEEPQRDVHGACGKRIAARGACRAAALAAACSSPPTAATPGPRSRRTRACPRDCGARSACRCRRWTAIASTR